MVAADYAAISEPHQVMPAISAAIGRRAANPG